MELSVGHRAGLKPNVKNLGHSDHHAVTSCAFPLDLIEDVLMEITRTFSRKAFQLVQRAHCYLFVTAIALPDRNARTPIPVAADRPVPGSGEPIAEATTADIVGDPMDRVAQLDHAISKLLNSDEPGRNRLEHERGAGAIAEGIGVGDALGPDELSRFLEESDQG